MEALTPTERPIVGLALEAPPEQARRATVAFRIILALPHLLWMLVLTLVGTVVVVVGWFAALFTGRLPDGIADFLAQILQYGTRVSAYLWLLTDTYPPFALEPRDYPVTVVLPPRGKLNRASVLFRLILAVPAMIVASVVSSGLQPLLLVMWLITLVSGRFPRSAFEAGSAALRYQTRFYAWILMLTSEYPGGLFGESDAAAPVGAIPPPPPAVAPGTIPPPPVAEAAATAPAPEPPRTNALVLTKPGRRLLVTYIVLGAVLSVVQVVAGIVAFATSSQSLRDLDDAYDEVAEASDDYGSAMQQCAVSGGAECAATTNAEFADDVRDFAADLEEIDFPEDAIEEAEDLRDDALATADLLDQLAATTSDPDAYAALVPELQTTVTQLEDHYDDLRDAIRFD